MTAPRWDPPVTLSLLCLGCLPADEELSAALSLEVAKGKAEEGDQGPLLSDRQQAALLSSQAARRTEVRRQPALASLLPPAAAFHQRGSHHEVLCWWRLPCSLIWLVFGAAHGHMQCMKRDVESLEVQEWPGARGAARGALAGPRLQRLCAALLALFLALLLVRLLL